MEVSWYRSSLVRPAGSFPVNNVATGQQLSIELLLRFLKSQKIVLFMKLDTSLDCMMLHPCVK